MKDNDFGVWIISGDEWIISYLSIHSTLTFGIVERFSIAQAFEHYFKACLVKLYNLEFAIKKSHEIYEMLKFLKNDTNFLVDIKIDQDVYDSYSIESNSFQTLSKEMQLKILDWQHLLLPFKYNSDLKYPRFKKAKGQVGMASIYPDMRFAHIFNQIRLYLSWEKECNIDMLKRTVDEKVFKNEESKTDFLKVCINGRT